MIEELYNKIDKFCNETDWSKYLTYEHALEEFIKVIVEEETKELEKENPELKAQLESERDLPAIAYMQGAEKQKKKDEEELKKWKDEWQEQVQKATDEGYARNINYEKGFKDGAEFGYNKANEWHYVKDGDLPECEEYVWCLFKNAQFPFIAKLYFGMADNDFHWKCLTTNEEYYECEVYAWKEIALPKEIE